MGFAVVVGCFAVISLGGLCVARVSCLAGFCGVCLRCYFGLVCVLGCFGDGVCCFGVAGLVCGWFCRWLACC